VDGSNHAVQVAQEAIAERDYEIEVKNHLIAELEKEVNHCQKHHPAPLPPPKWRGSDGAVSRFNIDAKRSPKSPAATNSSAAVSPSLISRPFTATPRQSTEGSPRAPLPKTPRPKVVAASSLAPSSSTGGSPLVQPDLRSQAPSSAIYSPLTLEALSAALASAAGTSKALTDASQDHHIRKPSIEVARTSKHKSVTTSPAHQSRKASNRVLQSPASSPNLRHTQDFMPSRTPPLPPIMSGGLGIFEVSNSETQDQKLRKKRAGLGDMFRRKDQGADSLAM
jgi:hypothetical protein